jgi:hypothetical protein
VCVGVHIGECVVCRCGFPVYVGVHIGECVAETDAFGFLVTRSIQGVAGETTGELAGYAHVVCRLVREPRKGRCVGRGHLRQVVRCIGVA